MNESLPKILITAPQIAISDLPEPAFNGVRVSYINAVIKAGGLPLILPLINDASALRQIAQSVDGVLLSGGEDIQPELYGEKCEPNTVSSPLRDQVEFELANLVEELELPCLAICRGCQL